MWSGGVSGAVFSCLGDASKQSVEWLDVVVVVGATACTAHLSTAVAVVGRAGVNITGGLSTASARQPRVTAQHCGEHVVQINIADDEQRPVPRRATTTTLQHRVPTLRTSRYNTCYQCHTDVSSLCNCHTSWRLIFFKCIHRDRIKGATSVIITVRRLDP